MKRMLIALSVGAVAFGGIFGLANSLVVSSTTLGSGTDQVVACQATPVNVSYTPDTPDSGDTTVTVGSLASTCNNKDIKVELFDGSSNSLGSNIDVTGTVTSKTVSFSGVSAEDVASVHVAIYG
jgi:hypothetical protein